MRRATYFLALALSLASTAGCDTQSPLMSPASLKYTENAFSAYREAMESFEDDNWEDARSLFMELRRLFSYSRYARLATLRLADIDFEQEKFSEAIAAYRSFIRSNATDTTDVFVVNLNNGDVKGEKEISPLSMSSLLTDKVLTLYLTQ